MSLIEVGNVSKSFVMDAAELLVLKGINFTVQTEFLCILGPSGCGKSTLLRLIAGLDRPSSGSVLFRGQPVTGPTLEMGFIFQTFALLPWKTVLENVEIGLIAQGLSREERHAKAEKYIKDVGLEGFEGRYPKELSGGMKQRVGIARALALEPTVLLMDEPFSSLDALTADALRAEMLHIWQSPDLPTNTFIMVTHNVQEAVFMADRIILLSPRPGTVIGDFKVDIPRPRVTREPSVLDLVDEIVGHMSQHAGPPKT